MHSDTKLHLIRKQITKSMQTMKMKSSVMTLSLLALIILGTAFTTDNTATVLATEENQMMNQDKKIGYIILLDETAFPQLEKFKKETPGSERPTAEGETAFEKFAKEELKAFAKKKLGVKAKDMTQFYSGMMFGFAVSIPLTQKEDFLKKAKAAKEITTIEEDRIMEIN